MDERELRLMRLMTLLFIASCLISVGLWAWILHDAFGWLAVVGLAVVSHGCVLVFIPRRWGSHILAATPWALAALSLWLDPPLPWSMVICLAFSGGIQTALTGALVGIRDPAPVALPTAGEYQFGQ